MSFRIVGGCPVNATLAPYIEILRRESGCTINSLYRGRDARAILQRHGKHDQAWLYEHLPAGVANPPGISTHELRSDGRAYPSIPVGQPLQWWQQGIDVNDADVPAVKAAARKYGWIVFQPYKVGVEVHHLNFIKQPKARTRRTRARLIYLRARLPRR